MGNSVKYKECGFTVVELLIALTIGLIVLAALVSVFIQQRKTYDVQEQITEMIQNARAAMDMMSREIRMAAYDPTDAGFNGIAYDATQMQVQADLNGDGNTSSGANEMITYSYDGANFKIDRTLGAAGTPVTFAENIQSFTFDYLDSTGASTTTAADIRQIRITIVARTAKSDLDYPGGYRTYTLTSLITPKNLAL